MMLQVNVYVNIYEENNAYVYMCFSRHHQNSNMVFDHDFTLKKWIVAFPDQNLFLNKALRFKKIITFLKSA